MGRAMRWAGWPLSLGFAAFVLVGEAGAIAVGGDPGAFAHVTFHFLVAPSVAIVVAILGIAKACVMPTWRKRAWVLSSVAVPAVFLWFLPYWIVWLQRLGVSMGPGPFL
jgi:uncharacterized MnhB-related membrane protein